MIVDIAGMQLYCTEIGVKEMGGETFLSLGSMTAWSFTINQEYEVKAFGKMKYQGRNSKGLMQFKKKTHK